MVLLLALAACEQPPAHDGPWRVVVLEPDDPPPPAECREALLAGVDQGAGAAPERSLRAVRAPAAALADRLREELAAGADLVLTVTTAALAAARPSAPAVVFTDVADPAAGGATPPALLARWLPALFAPSGPPLAGAYAVNDFGALLDAAEPLLPAPALGAVFAAGDADSVAYRDQLRALTRHPVLSQPLGDGAAAAVRGLCDRHARTLVLLGDRSTDAALADLVAGARACRMLVLGTRAAHAPAGAVLTLAADQRAAAVAAGRRAAALMRGERPQLEPFERVTAARLILNAEAAEQAGVGLPLGLLAQADDVIGD
ncbi:hypothetical protein KF840_06365 [bacterium]|nr:hypothetical protein [bacterium]